MHPNALEQLRVFQLIVEKGSFSKAAKSLGRAVSAVSYTINTLEEQVGFALFDRSFRQPSLTDEGRMFVRETEMLLRRVERMEAQIHLMRSKVEAVLAIAVDAAFPQSVLVSALAGFDELHPHVALNVSRSYFNGVIEDVRSGRVGFGIVPLERGMQWDGVDGTQIVREVMVPVAAPTHPLGKIGAAIGLRELEDYRQIHLAEGPPGTDVMDYRVHHTDVWLVDGLPLQCDLLAAGLGWGFVPSDVGLALIKAGRLVEIDCKEIEHAPSRRFSVIWSTARPPGLAGTNLVEQLQKEGRAFGPAAATVTS